MEILDDDEQRADPARSARRARAPHGTDWTRSSSARWSTLECRLRFDLGDEASQRRAPGLNRRDAGDRRLSEKQARGGSR